MKEYRINGYVITSWYAGFDTYCVKKDGKEIMTTMSLADIGEVVGMTGEQVREELWIQR